MKPADLAGLFLEFLEQEHGITQEDLRQALSQRDESQMRADACSRCLVPVQAFTDRLGAFETVVKYLREAYGLRHAEIAGLVNRSEATVRGTYRNAVRKLPDRFLLQDIPAEVLVSSRSFPVRHLADRSFSVFEHLVMHLLGQGLRLRDIALALGRDDRTVWTIKRRAERKSGGKVGKRRKAGKPDSRKRGGRGD